MARGRSAAGVKPSLGVAADSGSGATTRRRVETSYYVQPIRIGLKQHAICSDGYLELSRFTGAGAVPTLDEDRHRWVVWVMNEAGRGL